ncbi:hypothetical protein DFH11DRAFT_1747724 [Phellopilus nigrolimitatus]|nr:hypothetical protein DFH11DRAFT_1747724 [Phellopilus nigrolimitatus]
MPSRGSRMPAAATNCGDTEDLASHVLQRPARSLNSVRKADSTRWQTSPPPPPPRAANAVHDTPRAALLNPKANRGKRMLDARRTRCEVTSGGVSVGWWIGCGFSARDGHAPSRGPPLGCECDERKKAAGNGSDRIYNDCKSIHNYQKIIYNASDRIYNYQKIIYNDCKSIHNYQKIIYNASDRIYNYQKIIYNASDRIYNYQKIIYKASDRIYNYQKIIYKASDRIHNYQKIIYNGSDRIYNSRKTSTEDLQ